MLKATYYCYIFFLLTIGMSRAQGLNDFKKTIYHVKGDLNRDGRSDLVIVKADTVDKHHPYLLEILFAKGAGGYSCVFRSQNTIMARFPIGDQQSELLLEQLKITNGILIFTNQRIRGNMTHKFRYQNGNFELIGYTERNAGVARIDCRDINLLTGRQVVWQELYEKDGKTSQIISFKKYKVLPKLQDFDPLTSSYVKIDGSRVEF
ncbi:hypothetical protein EG353_08910 [Chryseobacterium shandongense]|uniref:VCBS repeat-containing protein n=2 Tax=Chryseobacterium shandongense TaxID=1493872 RepID=A0ABN5RYB1_9FLAO|nr:hypothetical protein EG353_08910 [Chryseobacterium shandongense]